MIIGDAFNISAYGLIDIYGDTVLKKTKMRTISPENPTGLPGQACLVEPGPGNQAYELGKGYKARPKIVVDPGQTVTMGEFEGNGAIGRIWATFDDADNASKLLILEGRFDRSPIPSFKCPIGSFFCTAWGQYGQVSSRYATVNPRGFESYHLMPFRKDFQITVENIGSRPATLYYSIDFELIDEPIPSCVGYFNAQYNLSNPALNGLHPVVDIEGSGHWKGVSAAWRSNEFNWWGEGMWLTFPDHGMKPLLWSAASQATYRARQDQRLLKLMRAQSPTNVWQGTEDFFGGGYDFIDPETGMYKSFSTPHTGMVEYPQRGYRDSPRRFGLYRWLQPAVSFEKSFIAACQVMGVRHSDGHFATRHDSVATTAIVYTKDLPRRQPYLPPRASLEAF